MVNLLGNAVKYSGNGGHVKLSVREDARSIPVYAMSANVFDEDVKRSFASGMNGHLSKPVNVQVLEETLKKELL